MGLLDQNIKITMGKKIMNLGQSTDTDDAVTK